MAKLLTNLSNLYIKTAFNSVCHRDTHIESEVLCLFVNVSPELDASVQLVLQRKFWVVGFSASVSKNDSSSPLLHHLVLTRSLHFVKSLFRDLCICRVSQDWVKPASGAFRTGPSPHPHRSGPNGEHVSPSRSPSL